MPFQLAPFADVPLTRPRLQSLLDTHQAETTPRLDRLWRYYRNPVLHTNHEPGARPRLAQSEGLPRRLTSPHTGDDRAPADREIVIENDIAWRLHAMVDFMLGRPITIHSSASDDQRRAEIQRILDAVLEASGGMSLLQDAALIASIYGTVDFVLRTDALTTAPHPPSDFDDVIERATSLRIDVVEPRRAIPIINPTDYRQLDAYIIHTANPGADALPREGGHRRAAVLAALRSRLSGATEQPSGVTEIISARHDQRYEGDTLVHDAPNPLGVLPVVHIQNLSQPYTYEGLSDVEPLIPLQDELNTRLSDRAHRVTLQSFKLYLAKGLDDESPIRAVTPGQVWTTSNPDASIDAFGGDAASPSEDNHIQHIREALDKTSAINPIAAGLLRARVGQLSSENALRITLLGAIAKTQRKQLAFGRGLAHLARLILHALDHAGVYPTSPNERDITVQWPDPIPRAASDALDEAQRKLALGVPRDRVLAELGYAPFNDAVL